MKEAMLLYWILAGVLFYFLVRRWLYVTVHEITVNEPWYSHLAAGTKMVEGRLCRDRYRTIRPGHALHIRCRDRPGCSSV